MDEIKITLAPEKKVNGAVLKVIGVGGAGGNAVNRMIEQDLRGVDFIAVNTDIQDLAEIRKPATTLQIGEKITKGLGAGSNPAIGEQAAIEDTESVMDLLDGAHMVFLTAGMGGGTGTGATHVIANHASSLGILTVAVVTKPFQFEREKRMKVAEDGIEKLKEAVDAIIVIPNQRLLDLGIPDLTLENAYHKADEILHQAVRGISDMINTKGAQNVDFADVRTTMAGKGITLMGSGEAAGENRAEEAARKALNSPLLDNVSIAGATGILYNITAAASLTLHEVSQVSDMITQNADPDATIKFGVVRDEGMKDTLRVTVIATGFRQPPGTPLSKTRASAPLNANPSPVRRPTDPVEAVVAPTPGGGADLIRYINDKSFPSMTHSPENDAEDPWDIPSFRRPKISSLFHKEKK